jgi:hypothetical protein
MTSSASEQVQLSFAPASLMAAYRERRYEDVSEILLGVLRHFRTFTYYSLDRKAQHFLDVFVKHFLYLFTQEDYVPIDRHMREFIDLNPLIANVVAMSSFRTTDAHIEILKNQTHNFAKMLALYSARNTVPLDRRMLFDTEPGLATQWYFCFWENYKYGCAGKETLQHLREHLRFRDERMRTINNYLTYGYFGCTYADFENDHQLKQHINRMFQQWEPAQVPILNSPNYRKIAVITSTWFPRQSVYRCTHSFVKALAAEFDLTLVHLGPERPDLDTSLFKELRRFQLSPPVDLSMLTPNDWGIAYYPDIGMNIESIFLSNLRIAPIQICGYGHPVSTFGSRIDYWLGGRDIESLEDHESNYSERLVLLPGSGVAPNKPDYVPQDTFVLGDILFINCAWIRQKINYPLLDRLKRILERSRRKIKFRFFVGGGSLDDNAYLPLKRVLSDILAGESIELFDAMPYSVYMTRLGEGSFNLDSYPFGGYATAIDAIYLRKPIITWEGKKFYNRSAASVLRHVGLEELIVHDAGAYEELALKLIHEDGYREQLRAKLAKIDLDKTIFARADAKAVVKAFSYLVENHEKLRQDRDRRPIVIDA